MTNNVYHEPVMVQEVLDYLKLSAPLKSQGTKILDATVGFGGHAIEICKKGANLVGLDADREALKVAGKNLEESCPTHLGNKVGSFKLIHANFKDMEGVVEEKDFDGVLFDLGVNTFQLKSETRGMSFSNPDAPLDMRIDKENMSTTASDLLNALREDQLIYLFEKTQTFAESKRLAKAVIERRRNKNFSKVGEVLSIIQKVFPKTSKIHPATKAFLALRMAVNSELTNLNEGLVGAYNLLKDKGRLVVISFHSGEDMEVKRFFRQKEASGSAIVITQKALRPSEKEIEKNKRARSAKMRVLEKIHQ